MPSFSATPRPGRRRRRARGSPRSGTRRGRRRRWRRPRARRPAPGRAARAGGRRRTGRRRSARRRPGPRRSPAASRAGGESARRRPGPALGSTPASRRPRPLAAAGMPSRPAPSTPARPSRSAICSSAVAPRRRRAGGSRSPKRTTTSRRPRRRPGEPASVALASQPATPARARAPAGQRRARAPARQPRRPPPARGRSGARRGDGVERARPARRHRQLDPVAADALADAQVEDRRVVDRLAVEHQHGVGELEVGDARPGAPGSSRRAGAPSGRAPAGAGVEVRRAERVAQQPARSIALLVGRPAAGQRGRALAGAGEIAGGRGQSLAPTSTGRSSPPSRTQRLGQPLLGVDRLVGEAALVAQPAVVDARRGGGRARAGRARRGPSARCCTGPGRACRSTRPLDVPRPGAEAVGDATSARRPGTAR